MLGNGSRHQSRVSMTFSAYYRELQSRCGVANPVDLVGLWLPAHVNFIKQIVDARAKAHLINKVIPNLLVLPSGRARSNQSKGNVAADFCAERIHDGVVLIEKLGGRGYPDRRIVLPTENFSCAFELKATSQWDEGDGNRRVITSSYTKLESAIQAGKLPNPPCHLMGTILYDDNSGLVTGLRLDFLEPTSPVNVRLEASTSHELLHSGAHTSLLIS